MKNRITNFLTLLLFVTVLSHHANAQITVTIKDIETNKPLAGANAKNISNGAVYVTDTLGQIDLPETAVGEKFRISHVGYQTLEYTLLNENNNIFMQPDYQILSTVTVTGYENRRDLAEIAGAYAIDSRETIDRFKEESLVRSMNTMPGIRLEERSPGSYRVNIRGNLLRAPYGVRNVKVYWNDIPYTDPNGSTPLNLLDLYGIGRVETIKGPAGTVYGAGVGGVLNIYGRREPAKRIAGGVGFTAGSYGYFKTTASLSTGNDNQRFDVRYAKQKTDGYRDHTNMDREVIQLNGAFNTSEKGMLSANILFTDLFYQLPGGLTREQYDENPRQARPRAAEQNSSINHQNLMAGLVHEYEWNRKLRNITSIYLTSGVKENPFITNYELERLNSYGGRTVFYIDSRIGSLPATFTTGAEINYGNYHANNHGNVNGYADTLRYEDRIKTMQGFLFFQGDLSLSQKWLLTAGASLNYLNYDIHRLKDVALDTSYRFDRTFRPEFMPRIGIVGKLASGISLHGSVSTGFSPPTSEEIRTSDGGINRDLEAEKAMNFEIGMRGNALRDKLYYDVTAFWMRQKETIVSRTTEGGTVVFDNAGTTNQGGLEILVGYNFIKDPQKVITLVRLQTAYTYHNFKFADYTKRKGGENVDYSGNALTGTAPNIFVTTFDFASHRGLSFHFTHNFTDKIPLNDANTVYGDAYHLIDLKVACTKSLFKKHTIVMFVGIDNLLNQKYSLGNDLNAYGSRYFNPSPERNYYGGIRINFNQ